MAETYGHESHETGYSDKDSKHERHNIEETKPKNMTHAFNKKKPVSGE